MKLANGWLQNQIPVFFFASALSPVVRVPRCDMSLRPLGIHTLWGASSSPPLSTAGLGNVRRLRSLMMFF